MQVTPHPGNCIFVEYQSVTFTQIRAQCQNQDQVVPASWPCWSELMEGLILLCIKSKQLHLNSEWEVILRSMCISNSTISPQKTVFFFFSRPFLDYIYVFVLVCRIAMQIYNHIVLCFKIISIPKSKPLFLSCLFSHPLLKRRARHLHTVLFLSCGRYYLKSKISVSRFFCSVFLSLCWGILPWLLLYLFPCIISQWSSRSCTVRKRYNSSLVVFLDSFPAGITFQHKQELHRRIMSLD